MTVLLIVLSLNAVEPDWSIYDFEQYPSVKWKLLNLQKFKDNRPDDYQQHLALLNELLNGES